MILMFCSISFIADIEASRAAGLDLYDYGDINELLMDQQYISMEKNVSSMMNSIPPPPVSATQALPPPPSLINGKNVIFLCTNRFAHYA